MRLLLPQYDVTAIHYFTSIVSARPNDPSATERQAAYLRALGTVPGLTIHRGYFLNRTKRRPLVHPPETGPRTVEVFDSIEKTSDVNLASHLLADGYEDNYGAAVVVSNDSDLELPVAFVRTRIGKEIGVIDPSPRRSNQLSRAATWYRPLRKGPLSASLFPETLPDADGRTIRKPPGW